MKRLSLAIAMLGAALLVFSVTATGASALNADFVFGKAEYSDADENGFDDATLSGFRLSGEFAVTEKIDVAASFLHDGSWNAVALDPDWVPVVESDGTDLGDDLSGDLYNSVFDIAGVYNFGDKSRLGLGIGWMGDWFKVTEPGGYKETRRYSGLELLAKLNLSSKNEALSFDASVKYAPSLSVKDWATGDWNDSERTAEVTYDGSYAEFQVGLDYALRENVDLGVGYRYSKLQGDGADHDEYRFLEHDYTTSGFYVGIEMEF